MSETETSPITADGITPERVEKISALVAGGAGDALLVEIADDHEADIAHMIGLLPPERRVAFVRLVGDKLAPEVFAELDGGVRDEVVEFLDLDTLVGAVQELDSDEAVFVLEDLDEDDRAEVLEKIPAPERMVLERALDFPEDSAGRMMRSEYVAVPPHWTVGQTIDYLRETEDLPEDFLEIFIIDPIYKPMGIVHLSEILRTERDAPMQNLVHEDFTIITADTDREEVARMFERYNLVSTAVVDANARLIGVITADDVFEVMSEEAGEDILRLGGVGDEDVTDTVFEAARGRFSWLFLNLLTAIFASIVIGWFDASIEQMVALAVLMPIVASMGGNAGTQTLTVAVRSLAVQDLQMLNARRYIYRELGIGALNGMLFALVVGAVGYLWFGSLSLGVVLGVAMIINLVAAALAGILIPLGLDRAGIDPAIASAVLVTTITDVMGFFVFLGVATIFLL